MYVTLIYTMVLVIFLPYSLDTRWGYLLPCKKRNKTHLFSRSYDKISILPGFQETNQPGGDRVEYTRHYIVIYFGLPFTPDR